jgi:multiple sugar transport system permease protein
LEFDFFGLFKFMGLGPINLVNQPTPILLLALFGLGFKNGLFIFLTRQFFINLPHELDESAKIDGAGFIRIFFQITLPNAIPILITIYMFGFSWQWTDQFMTGMFMTGQRYFGMTLPAMIVPAAYKGFNNMEIAALVTTGVLLILTPLLILYIFLQRFFVQGIERSGLVG